MFITFEGLDGCGKTTQITLLAAALRRQGLPVLTTREPGGTRIGDQIRDCLHDVNNTAMTATAEILLYSASRAQLVREVIRPALAAGKIVLCDRFADSTLAYQGYGRELDLDDLAIITEFATGGLRPDLTIWLALDVKRSLQRRQAPGEEINRMDLQTATFYRRVEAGYQALVAADKERWVVLDGDRPPAEVHQEVLAIVSERLQVRQAQPGAPE